MDRGKEISLEDKSQWMTLDKAPQAISEEGKYKVILDFHGKMGSDEDEFTVTINPTTGAST